MTQRFAALTLFTLLLLPSMAIALSHFSKRLPFHEDVFAIMAAAANNVDCGGQKSPGESFGDFVVEKSFGDGFNQQRTTIYHHKTLGIIVATQGTNFNSEASVGEDKKFGLTSKPSQIKTLGGLVMEGWKDIFDYSWGTVHKDLTETVKKYGNPDIYITGHSSGAAVGSLIGYAVQTLYPENLKGVIVFASPRVGDLAFVAQYDSHLTNKYVNVVNGDDLVPTLPFTTMGYAHFKNMVWIHPHNSNKYHFSVIGDDPVWLASRNHSLTPTDHTGVYFGTSIDLGNCDPTLVHDVF